MQTINAGIDIGGTKVNIGLVTEEGQVLRSRKFAVADYKGPEEVAAAICRELTALAAEEGLTPQDLSFVGAGVPGTADWHTGHVLYCPNLQWFDVPLGRLLTEGLGREVVVSQDSRCAALAEYLFGAGREFKDMLVITLGTGVGCGIIVDGRIVHGGMNTAGEFGHCSIDRHGVDCVCGSKGCLERYASGWGMVERAFEAMPEKLAGQERRAETLFTLAETDPEVKAFIEARVEDLAFALSFAVGLLSPEAILLSGGMCQRKEYFLEPLRRMIPQWGDYAWTSQNKLRVEMAQLGPEAPMVGASALYRGL